MKTKTYLILLIAIIAASCTSLQQSTVNDDIYYSPKDPVIVANKENVKNIQSKNTSTIFGNTYDKQITDILEDESINEIDTAIVNDSEYNSYENEIVVDSYGDAWEKRQNARNSLYYGSNYLFITTTDAYRYAAIYANDPYYNVIIMGDQVWVEPYYISSSFGYWPHTVTYNSFYYGAYYDPFHYGYSPYYYSYYSPYRSYYSPYYYPYYSPYKSYYSVKNENYASSSFHSYRQRSLSSTSARRSTSARASRELPETYAGRDVRGSSTVKSGLDRQTVRQDRAGAVSRTRTNDVATPRVVREGTRSKTATSTASNRNYTRPQSTSRSTYNATTRSTTRYSRPASSNVSSGRSTSTSGRSTYSQNKSTTSGSRSGSSYTGNSRSSSSKSSGNYSRSSVKSSGNSSRSSGSSSRSSGSSGRSSGSSSKSSSSSSRSGGGRR